MEDDARRAVRRELFSQLKQDSLNYRAKVEALPDDGWVVGLDHHAIWFVSGQDWFGGLPFATIFETAREAGRIHARNGNGEVARVHHITSAKKTSLARSLSSEEATREMAEKAGFDWETL